MGDLNSQEREIGLADAEEAEEREEELEAKGAEAPGGALTASGTVTFAKVPAPE